MRGGFTGNALLIADAARQEALAELAERTKSTFYASTADDVRPTPERGFWGGRAPAGLARPARRARCRVSGLPAAAGLSFERTAGR